MRRSLGAATLRAMAPSARRLVKTAWVWFVLSCATASGPEEPRRATDPHAMYPMHPGNAWSYDVDTGAPATTLAVTRVEAREGHQARVRTGEKVVRYQLDREGIRTVPEGRWLLRTPFVVGAQWAAPGGRDARVVSVAAALQTPAGSFEGCLEVLETGGELDLEVRTVYCPGVGPVSVASTMRSKVSERSVTVTATLRGYAVSPP